MSVTDHRSTRSSLTIIAKLPIWMIASSPITMIASLVSHCSVHNEVLKFLSSMLTLCGNPFMIRPLTLHPRYTTIDSSLAYTWTCVHTCNSASFQMVVSYLDLTATHLLFGFQKPRVWILYYWMESLNWFTISNCLRKILFARVSSTRRKAICIPPEDSIDYAGQSHVISYRLKHEYRHMYLYTPIQDIWNKTYGIFLDFCWCSIHLGTVQLKKIQLQNAISNYSDYKTVLFWIWYF